MGVVSFLNDLSSEMIFPFIPVFLTSVLGASLTFVGLVEGLADSTASILKIASGWISDKLDKRKNLAVFGYSLSAVSKPFLAAAMQPWHVLGVRFMDRVGKGARDAPRDALVSFSTESSNLGRAFGFHRAMDTLGAALGPLVAFAVLPLISNNYRLLFILSFIASFFSVLVLVLFVREVSKPVRALEPAKEPVVITDIHAYQPSVPPGNIQKKSRFASLGLPFFLFLGVATVASLGKASDAFLILKAREVGVAIALLPILYFAFNMTFALLSTPLGILADKVGKRNTFVVGLFVFAVSYLAFASTTSPKAIWFVFIVYGLYYALTEGVGRAVVAGLVPADNRGTAFGVYNAFTGLALLPASLAFGYISQHWGSRLAFSCGAVLSLFAALLFVFLRNTLTRDINLNSSQI